MSGQEKAMLIFIILLVIAIITRWGYIKTEAAGAIKDRFNRIQSEQFTGEGGIDNTEDTDLK